MDSRTYSRLQRAVEALVGAPRPDWEALLAEHSGGDPEFAAKARELARLATDESGAFDDENLMARRSELDRVVDAATAAADWAPDRVGPYRILSRVGQGGSGVVFRALQDQPRREVALKLLSPAFATPATMDRLRREAEILARLQHPGIAQVHDAGRFDGGFGEQPYLVMELIDGVDVVSDARARGLDLKGRLLMVLEILDAVAHAHGRGVVHRDLKPENILVDQEGRPRLLDFGIARLCEGTLAAGVTLEGQLLGTAAYMAPEQVGGAAESGPEADVFSVGAIAFELTVNRRPRDLAGLSITDALRELSVRDVPRARTVDRSIPRDLDTVLARALETDPRRRYPSAEAFAADLRRFLDHRPIAARPPGAFERAWKWVRRNRTLTAGVATTVLVLIAGLITTSIQAARAREASARARRGLYASEMIVATAAAMDPVTRGRAGVTLERWAPGNVEAAAIDESGELRWEWMLLDSVQRHRAVVLDCRAAPMSLAWHPGGEWIAVAMSSTLALHDASTGAELEFLQLEAGSRSLLLDVAWSPDGRRLAASGLDGAVVWRPGLTSGGDGTLEASFPVGFLPSVDWRDDDRLWGVGDRLFEFDLGGSTRSMAPAAPLLGLADLAIDPVTDRPLARASDGRLIAVAPDGGASRILFQPGTTLTCVDVDPTGSWLAAAAFESTVELRDAATGVRVWASGDHREPVLSCDWHPTEPWIATGSDDGTVRILEAAAGAPLLELGGHRNAVRKVAWAPGGRRIASVSSGDLASVWDTSVAPPIRRLRPEGASPDIRDVGRLGWDPRTRVLHVSHHGVTSRFAYTTASFDGPSRPVDTVLAPSGALEATVLGGYRVRVGPVGAPPEEGRVLEIGQDTSLVLDWIPGADVICAGNSSGVWRLSAATGGPSPPVERLHEVDLQLTDLRVSPSGRYAAATSTYAAIYVTDLRAEPGTAPRELTLEAGDGARSLAWSPDGSAIAVGTSSANVHLFRASDGRLLASLEGASRTIHALAWHPSGGRIAAGGRDGTIKLWSLASGALVASFPVAAHVADLLWIDGGRGLACLDFDGVVTILDASRAIDGR